MLSEFSAISAKGYFDSRRIRGGPEWHASPRLKFAYNIEELVTTGENRPRISDADGRLLTFTSEWNAVDSLRIGLTGLREHRVVTLSDTSRGADVRQWKLSLSGYSSRLSVERAVVDTLTAIWSRERTRWRVSGDTRRRIGNLDYATAISWQRIADRSGVRESAGLQTTLDYRDSRRKIHATYEAAIADEERQERGLAWLEVGEGLGGYRYENGEYVADPFGQFIQVEEVLSGRARVRRIERSSRISRDWSRLSISVNSRITEERITDRVWSPQWLAPVITDPSSPRQFLDRNYDVLLRAFPVSGVFVVNLRGVDGRQTRRIGGSLRNQGDRRISATFKQPFGDYLAEEEGEWFEIDKDSWYSGGDARGLRLATTLRRAIEKSELACAVRYRHATGEDGAASSLLALEPSAQIRKQSLGDLRCEIELYTQKLSGAVIPYSLTDGHGGRRGVHWIFEANAAVTKSLRFTARLQGRHADNAKARVQARSELVASF
ncbi:MAG: hypothetical protein HY851_10305 [candidate division Zixibacteria bacterium]|nr:hypothetical protein [candidate division Zixibacteria bacterium]